MRFAAAILAAGSGSRAGSGAAKQWRRLAGRPVLRWSVDALLAAGASPLVVTVPAGEEGQARDALAGVEGVQVIIGGETRAQSAMRALDAMADDPPDVVLVHDAARPFVGRAHIESLLAALADADGAVPVLPVADTLKRGSLDAGLATVSREGLHRVQTPQAFHYDRLVKAYAAWPGDETPTDDAMVVERAGGRVAPVPGDPRLMKLTYPEDFAMAEALAGQSRITRIGQGFDVHGFAPGDGVWLCGVKIAHDLKLEGHSDADAGLHALTDAILGAIGEGDIGDHFPPSDPQWKDAASSRFLAHAVGLLLARGGRVVNADVTLVCEAPRIKPHREAMRARLAELLGVAPDRVSVKATTTEGLGFTGRREGLAAQAVVAVDVPG
jgi:2-C-methyl-D-erythritol 4-phosphate cytidylyltransferase/2-C-methyl-D-erythritol 2,4-cyclodiphosphate synthase